MRGPCLKYFLLSKSVLQAFFTVEIVMPLVLALHFANETTHNRMSRDSFCSGDVRLNFPKFT